MEFRILGRLEVVGPGGSVEVTGPKRRALLAYLLAHNGAVIPIDRIVDDLWDGSPSEGAVGTVRTYVSQLRKLLSADCAIETHPSAYRLVLRAGALDAEAFEHLSATAASTADPEPRLRTLDDALALWSGAPLAEFSGSFWADAIATRLDAVWLNAARLRFDTMLELGRHAEALPAIQAAARDHPLDEHLAAQLMLAYYRTGRQADALGAFAEVRAALVDQLGLDPGPELRDLERRILDHDSDLMGGFETLAVRAVRASSARTAAAERRPRHRKIFATLSVLAVGIVILLLHLAGSLGPGTTLDENAPRKAHGSEELVAEPAPPTAIAPTETARPEATPPETATPETATPTRQASAAATSPPAPNDAAPSSPAKAAEVVVTTSPTSPTFATYPDGVIGASDGTR
jgi:DNA-binding SARP family transcriptional activator